MTAVTASYSVCLKERFSIHYDNNKKELTTEHTEDGEVMAEFIRYAVI